ncbi:hypothetical protein SADUNF_Sadunf16G0088400 [Salix dunnii]|uniref:C2H2-type domain-containing protein n=1 Tax=Salix dunnii TaxID=1413687 RepID=A0A835J7S1_9ROSI|nr:hypothetical protein SADUNF_Sadunf16G0088400 [Salix dunnii]
MDITDKPDQKVCSADDLQGSSHERSSYTCAFCKRCFSNAQGLGGHMNIHRRDRAKLKQVLDENFLSLDLTNTTEEISFAPKPHVLHQLRMIALLLGIRLAKSFSSYPLSLV